MSIPPARRYRPDSPIVLARLSAVDSCAHRHTSPEDKLEPVRTSDGRFKVQSFSLILKLVDWRNFAHKNGNELQSIMKVGLLPFLLLNWAYVMAAPRIELVEEFVNAVDIDVKTCLTAHVCGWLVKSNGELIQQVLKLLRRSTMESLVEVEQPLNYHALDDAESNEGYIISKCNRKFRLHLRGEILALSFNRKMTYVSNKDFVVLATAEIISTCSDGSWNSAQWILESHYH